jgi:type IX secretion system PorP/SprF family membrane protein
LLQIAIFYFFILLEKFIYEASFGIMKKTISFLYLLLLMKLVAFSQQDPLFTNNMYYKLGINPGFAGAEDALSGIILNRYQWEGFPGAAKTLVFSVDAAVGLFGSPGGMGLNIVSDKVGYEENITINANYAYKVPLSFGNLGIGLSLGMLNKGINTDGEAWRGSDDVLAERDSEGSGDYLIPQGEVSQVAFDVGSGLYLSSNHYFVGISATHINQAFIRFNDLATTYMVRHYYLTGGYNIKLSDPLFELRPSFFLRSDLAGWQLDVNTNLVYDERFWGGLSYRINDAVALLMGLELSNGLRVGYSFDLVTSAIGYYSFASHEIFISYSVNLERNRNQKYKSVRFL